MDRQGALATQLGKVGQLAGPLQRTPWNPSTGVLVGRHKREHVGSSQETSTNGQTVGV